MNYQAAEKIAARIEALDAIFDRIADTASAEAQQKLIDTIDSLRDALKSAKARTITNWSEYLAANNID